MLKPTLVAVACAALAAFRCVTGICAPLALTGATIIDGTGSSPIRSGTIIIDGGRIVAVGPTAEIRIPHGAQRWPLGGKYIIPGLMDANVHLDYWLRPELLTKYEGRYQDIILEAAQVALKSGVTTVFDTWGPRQALIDVREKINTGAVVGSRMFLAGNIIGLGGPFTPDFNAKRAGLDSVDPASVARINALWTQGVGEDLLWKSSDEVRSAVRAYIAAGQLDFVKYASSGHAQEQFISFSPDAQRAIVEEAHRAGLTVQAHTTSPESLKMEIDAGADILTHCDVSGIEPIPQATIDRIVQKRLPCSALIQTQASIASDIANEPFPFGIETHVKDINDRKLIAAGALLILATDAGYPAPADLERWKKLNLVEVPTRLDEGVFLWLQGAAEAGMAPMEALLAATRNVAAAYKRADLGTLEPGKSADLVVLDADPLADPQNYRRIHAVMLKGKKIDRDALPTHSVFREEQRLWTHHEAESKPAAAQSPSTPLPPTPIS